MGLAGKDAAKLAKPVANLVINDVTAYLNASEDADLAPKPAHARPCGGAGEAARRGRHLVQAGPSEVFAAIMDEGKDPSGHRRGARHGAGVATPAPSRPSWTPSSPRTPTRWLSYQGGNTKVIGLLRGPVHEGDARPGQPEDHQPAVWRRSWQNSAIAACGLRLATCGLCERKLVGCEDAVCGRVRQPTQTQTQSQT